MPRGGKRTGAGRRKNKPEKPVQVEAAGPVNKGQATDIIAGLEKGFGHEATCSCFKCLWRAHAVQRDASGQAALRYLWDRMEGKAVHTVNHLHDKPIEVTHTFKLAESIQKARQRAGATS